MHLVTLLKRVGYRTNVSVLIAEEYRTPSVSVLYLEILQYTPSQPDLHKHSPGCIQCPFI